MMVNVSLVWLAIRRIRSSHYASERRSSVRFETNLPGRLGGIAAQIRDLSLTGARIELPAGEAMAPRTQLVVIPAGEPPIELDGTVQSNWSTGNGSIMAGFEFDPGQTPARARLARMLFEERAARLPQAGAMPAATRRKRGLDRQLSAA